MRRLLATYALLFAALIAAWQTFAQVPMTGAGLGVPTVVAGYTGVGDVQSGWSAWWGVRCYTAAYSGNVADITDSATGNTTGTRLQCSGGVVSALVSSSACTFVTGNACSSLATTCGTACNIRTLYDQVGGGNCGGTCDLVQTTNANRPTFLNGSCGGGVGASILCLSFVSGSATVVATAGSNGLTAPYSFYVVGSRTVNGGFNDGIYDINGSTVFIGGSGSTNTWRAAVDGSGGFSSTSNLTEGNAHFLMLTTAATAQSFYGDNNAATTATETASGAGSLKLGTVGGIGSVTGKGYEAGIITGQLSSGVVGSIRTNINAYYGCC